MERFIKLLLILILIIIIMPKKKRSRNKRGRPRNKKNQTKNKRDRTKKKKINHNIYDNDLEICKSKKIVTIDPGKSNMVFMMDEDKNKLNISFVFLLSGFKT